MASYYRERPTVSNEPTGGYLLEGLTPEQVDAIITQPVIYGELFPLVRPIPEKFPTFKPTAPVGSLPLNVKFDAIAYLETEINPAQISES